MYHCCLEPCCGSYICLLHRFNLFLCCTVCPKHQQVRHKKVKVEKDICCDLTIFFVTLTFLNVVDCCLFVTGDSVRFCNCLFVTGDSVRFRNSKMQLANAKWKVSPYSEVLFSNCSVVIIWFRCFRRGARMCLFIC